MALTVISSENWGDMGLVNPGSSKMAWTFLHHCVHLSGVCTKPQVILPVHLLIQMNLCVQILGVVAFFFPASALVELHTSFWMWHPLILSFRTCTGCLYALHVWCTTLCTTSLPLWLSGAMVDDLRDKLCLLYNIWPRLFFSCLWMIQRPPACSWPWTQIF